MSTRIPAPAACALVASLVSGCASTTVFPDDPHRFDARVRPESAGDPSPSAFRPATTGGAESVPSLSDSSDPDDYVRFAVYASPAVEAAYQQWRAAAERVPQVGALPDPRATVGFFLDEVETRVGAQQARLGLSQAFPWPGALEARQDAAAIGALAAWRRFEDARLQSTERVVETLHELAYLDAATRATREMVDLLRSFEEVVRARYRVGAGSHPELVRVQVELGILDDRLRQLEAMRPAYAAALNAALNRPGDTPVPIQHGLPGRIASEDPAALAERARLANPMLLALDERVRQQRALGEVARLEGRPEFSVGLDYIVTNEAINSSIAESGDDPITLTFGVSLPIWRERYDAAVREATARRLAAAHERADEANRLEAAIHRRWFEHTDADRRVRLYEQTLIPKAQESLRASLAGFRAGDATFLDLLDTERTLLEFAIAAERARADRGQALARLNRLVGEPVPSRSESADTDANGVSP
ncbi:MAG: TolC family protein [Phycisphaeraceae bacterium]|nr:TolC family protein [Phycisphaeraceae bacterium]